MGIKSTLKGVASYLGYEIRRIRSPEQAAMESLRLLYGGSKAVQDPFLRKFAAAVLSYGELSCSQFGQDAFAASVHAHKRGGFFVEFGAADGVNLSNTYMLERELGWSGILAEPNRSFIAKIRAARSCAIEARCVWSASDETLGFVETDIGELSTIAGFAASDNHDRSKSRCYDVDTISLGDLLKQHSAPRNIDYLSMDTEGSEFEILSSFNFEDYRFGVITVEHNYTSARSRIYDLLRSADYVRVLHGMTDVDDWYVDRWLIDRT